MPRECAVLQECHDEYYKAETQPSCDPSHWVFSKADWELFDELCLERINEDILEEGDPLQSFVEHITKAANDSIPRATTIPKKSNPWFDEECPEALKARRALDKRVRQSREFRGESLSAFRKSQAQARRLFNQKKRKSWAEYVSKLSADTPIKHVWDRVRKISGKNICPPKQYLNGKNGTTITNPKDIADKHAAAFTDNSSSTHYSATFQAIKEQEEKNKIDFTSDNTEVYNKPFRLRDLRRSIMKTKPRAPGPWWDPQQLVEASPWGYTENPKRDPKQDMDLNGLSSSMESSNSDPNPQTK